jgi:hypothetical protein
LANVVARLVHPATGLRCARRIEHPEIRTARVRLNEKGLS